MNKKVYQHPAMRVLRIQHQCHILSGSVTGTEGPFGYGGGNSGPARVRSRGEWDEEWDDE